MVSLAELHHQLTDRSILDLIRGRTRHGLDKRARSNLVRMQEEVGILFLLDETLIVLVKVLKVFLQHFELDLFLLNHVTRILAVMVVMLHDEDGLCGSEEGRDSDLFH